jgi:hypothetical protein
MVSFLKDEDVLRFVAAAGVMAHYVGDASQPLHCSFMHHGKPPMKVFEGREYPVPRDSDEFKAFKKTRAALIHSIYEEGMLEIDTATLLSGVDDALAATDLPTGGGTNTGHDAGVAVIQLMKRSQDRLAPIEIIEADDPSQSAKSRAQALWNNNTVRNATIESLADSVQVLAGLWASAWKVGGGKNLDNSKLIELDQNKLNDLVRKDRKFVPSQGLAQMAASGGDFEPAGELVGAGAAPARTANRHRRS